MRVIDIHTHGFGPHETGSGDPHDVIGMARLHASSGVGAILPTVYASSITTMRRDMMAVKTAMEYQDENSSLRGDGPGAEILGIHLEGPFLNPDMSGALDRGSFLLPTTDNYMRLIDGFEDVVRMITVAPELEGSPALIKLLSDGGIIVSMGHSNATYGEAEAGYKAGARGITHIFNAMRPFHHREPGIAGFALMDPDIYIEVIADPHHLSDRLIEFIFRVKEPSRIILVSDLVRGPLPGGGARAIRDDTGRLRGGSMTITGAAGRLTALGIDNYRIEGAISRNPEKYLASLK
ncbi:MAG: N-acetylglucosamine-6-phosphate deacetylase [Deltaproteobacteria bacterium]|nr:N-acetylglucosamine-6-phosphate deacetylase [Deltaproteobacteria bacterium]